MKTFLFSASAIALFFGALFKIQHWPLATGTLVTGALLFTAFHLLVLREITRIPDVRHGTRVMWLALAVSLPYLGSLLFLWTHRAAKAQ